MGRREPRLLRRDARRAGGSRRARARELGCRPLTQPSAFERLRRDLFERREGHLAPLDGLRALAILSVVAFHTSVFSAYTTAHKQSLGELGAVQQWLFNLWSGVDVFFVLSGFLIGRILLRELEATGRISYAAFLARRSLRIFPAYYVVLTAVLLLVVPRAPRAFAYLFETRDFDSLAAVAWANYAYVSNYVVEPGAANPMSWAWSLCIEEHFYLLLPPLLWLASRGPRGALPLALGLGIGAPLVARALVYASDPGVSVREVYFQSHFRFDELFVGVALAHAHLQPSRALARATARAGLWLPIAGLLAIACVWAFGSPSASGAFRVVFQFPLLALGTGAILAHTLSNESFFARALAARAWVPIARVSYGMYLVHPYVLFAWMSGPFAAMFRADAMGPWVAALIAVVAASSWLVAAALYVVFERRGQELGARLAERLATGGIRARTA